MKQFSLRSHNTVILLLTIIFISTWIYFLLEQNSRRKKMNEVVDQYQNAVNRKRELNKNFDASLAKLDSLTGTTHLADIDLANTAAEIKELKNEITSILNAERISEKQIQLANVQIAKLNDKILSLKQQLAGLIIEHYNLVASKDSLVKERDDYKKLKEILEEETVQLSQKIKIASTLNASDITITAIKNVKNDKTTLKAEKAKKLVLGFDVENRIIDTGVTNLYISIVGPDGKFINIESQGKSTFISNEEGEKPYSAVIPVNVESGKRRRIEFAFIKNDRFKNGRYTISIYHNGFKIGEANKTLKKNALFG